MFCFYCHFCTLLAYNLSYMQNKFQKQLSVHNQYCVLLAFIFLSTISFRISEKYIEYAKIKFLETTDDTNLKDRNILQKLLCIDKQTAHVMALDILMSTDTVNMYRF